MKNPSSKYHLEEIPAIEFLRFFSALMILVFHYVHFTYKGTSLPQNLSNLNLPFYNFLWIFYEFGKYAVQIFWSISGFIFF
jgi:peptidoglycan/LPS O-acetylase OafA/YrhL